MAEDKKYDICSYIVVDNEYKTARQNNNRSMEEFEMCIDMLECKRPRKRAQWMSDISLPEYASHEHTEAAMFATQNFSQRDFVDCYLADEGSGNKLKARAAKECINRTLNQKHLYYYPKSLRAKMLNNQAGFVYAVCKWETEYQTVKNIEPRKRSVTDIDGIPQVVTEMIEAESEEKVIDRFNFEVVDPRNVFTDDTYCYSVQDKKWVIIRDEATLEELEADKETMGYFNLEEVKKLAVPRETDTSAESYNKDGKMKVYNTCFKPFDRIERHGKFWVIVKERLDDGYPYKIEPGYDDFGNVLEGAELIETIQTFIVVGTSSVCIRFQPQPYRDAYGRPYKPIIRGLCYIHSTKDSGLGDGKYALELQTAIDDTFNISNDRVMLATQPTIAVKPHIAEQNPDLYMAPGKPLLRENPDDMQEFKISDNINGALQQIGMLTGMFQQVRAVYPTTMGKLPQASTTATAVVGTDQRSQARSQYKSLTFEYTFLTDLYWQILQMTWQFASPETGLKLMGDLVTNFDPTADYIYKPISVAIEAEYSKQNKIKNGTTLISYLAQVPNPKGFMIINYLLADILINSGKEYSEFAKYLLDENAPMIPGGVSQTKNLASPVSNQNLLPMSGTEQMARGAVSE